MVGINKHGAVSMARYETHPLTLRKEAVAFYLTARSGSSLLRKDRMLNSGAVWGNQAATYEVAMLPAPLCRMGPVLGCGIAICCLSRGNMRHTTVSVTCKYILCNDRRPHVTMARSRSHGCAFRE